MKTLTHPSLLAVDEIGYLPVLHTGAMHFLQLMNRRYERASSWAQGRARRGAGDVSRRSRATCHDTGYFPVSR